MSLYVHNPNGILQQRKGGIICKLKNESHWNIFDDIEDNQEYWNHGANLCLWAYMIYDNIDPRTLDFSVFNWHNYEGGDIFGGETEAHRWIVVKRVSWLDEDANLNFYDCGKNHKKGVDKLGGGSAIALGALSNCRKTNDPIDKKMIEELPKHAIFDRYMETINAELVPKVLCM